MAALTGFELGQIGAVLVSDEDLETEALVVSEGELGAGMGTFAPADGTSSLWPGGQVEVGQLAHGGAFTLLAGLGDGRHPGALGHGQDGVAHGFGEVEADREADLERAQLVHEVVGGAAGVGAGHVFCRGLARLEPTYPADELNQARRNFDAPLRALPAEARMAA